jgi:hypothetical protein
LPCETCYVWNDGIRAVHVSSFYKDVCVHSEKFFRHDKLFCEPFYYETHHDANASIHNGSGLHVEKIGFRVAGDIVCHLLPALMQKL